MSEKCGITSRDLFNQPNFRTVLINFIKWIDTCVNKAKPSGISFYPGNPLSFMSTVIICYSITLVVLVAHNGFPSI